MASAPDRGAARLARRLRKLGTAGSILAAAFVVAAVTAASSEGSPRELVPDPYWVGNFSDGTFCQFATVFESTSVNPNLGADGYMPACPQFTPYAHDPTQRVYLALRPLPPAGAGSRWVSHQEIKTTDGPWFEGSPADKATLRLTKEQTLDGEFAMGATRWFRVSFYLPNPGFNWPAGDWYELLDLHNTIHDPEGHDWPTISLIVTPEDKNPRFIAMALDGGVAHTNYEAVKLLQLTKRNGSRILKAPKPPRRRSKSKSHKPVAAHPLPFNRWHTLVFGVTFSDQGSVGASPGWVRIYFDGKLVYAKARPNVWKNEEAVWLQLQNYKAHAAGLIGGATSSTIDFANARAGFTFAGVSR